MYMQDTVNDIDGFFYFVDFCFIQEQVKCVFLYFTI